MGRQYDRNKYTVCFCKCLRPPQWRGASLLHEGEYIGEVMLVPDALVPGYSGR